MAIDKAHREEYARLFEQMSLRKAAQNNLVESKKRSSNEYIVDAGEAYTATKRLKSAPSLNSSATGTTTELQIPNEKNLGNETPASRQSNDSTKQYHQQKLVDALDPQSESQLTMAIADMIHSCGLPFSLASHHKFHRVLTLAKLVSKKYIPPGRNKIAGELLDLNYQLYKSKMTENLLKDAEVYGMTFFGDGATVRKSPLINILASSVHCPVGCLRIVDCSGHLESDGRKDAAYIADLFLPLITEMEEKKPKCTGDFRWCLKRSEGWTTTGGQVSPLVCHARCGACNILVLQRCLLSQGVRTPQENESTYLPIFWKWLDALSLRNLF